MRFIICAGASGGHIKPAIIIAQEILKQGDEVLFIASNKKIDYKMLRKCNFQVIHMPMQGISRKKTVKGFYYNIKSIALLMKVNHKMSSLFEEFKPDVVIGFGGYITYPVVRYAIKKKIMTAIHEQNSFPGLVNRKLGSKVNIVFYCFESIKKYIKNSKMYNSSSPVCDVFLNFPKTDNQFDMLFLGGSLGSEKIINYAVKYANINPHHSIILVSGENNDINTNLKNLKIFKHLNNLENYIMEAKVIITRGGASTLMECYAAKKKVVVIPSPNVVEDHQTKNANDLKNQADMIIVNEENLTYSLLENAIIEVQGLDKYENSINFSSTDYILKKIKELND